MPSRRRSSGEHRARPWRPVDADIVTDPLSGGSAQLQRVQPYQAKKEYICPGCNQEIRVGTGHVVVVPLADSGHRRHWHTPCFERGRRHGVR